MHLFSSQQSAAASAASVAAATPRASVPADILLSGSVKGRGSEGRGGGGERVRGRAGERATKRRRPRRQEVVGIKGRGVAGGLVSFSLDKAARRTFADPSPHCPRGGTHGPSEEEGWRRGGGRAGEGGQRERKLWDQNLAGAKLAAAVGRGRRILDHARSAAASPLPTTATPLSHHNTRHAAARPSSY